MRIILAFFVLAAFSISIAQASEDVDFTHLPASTVASIPVDMIVNANDSAVYLGLENIKMTGLGELQVVCTASVPASSVDRILKGQLTLNISQVELILNMYTIHVSAKLNGRAVPITQIGCFSGAGDSSVGFSVADFREYIKQLGGSLSTSAPVPFGQ